MLSVAQGLWLHGAVAACSCVRHGAGPRSLRRRAAHVRTGNHVARASTSEPMRRTLLGAAKRPTFAPDARLTGNLSRRPTGQRFNPTQRRLIHMLIHRMGDQFAALKARVRGSGRAAWIRWRWGRTPSVYAMVSTLARGEHDRGSSGEDGALGAAVNPLCFSAHNAGPSGDLRSFRRALAASEYPMGFAEAVKTLSRALRRLRLSGRLKTRRDYSYRSGRSSCVPRARWSVRHAAPALHPDPSSDTPDGGADHRDGLLKEPFNRSASPTALPAAVLSKTHQQCSASRVASSNRRASGTSRASSYPDQ